MSPIAVEVIIFLIKAVLIINGLLMSAAYLVYFERKISAWAQNRIGPNRVGPLGLFQSFADVFKLYFKEDVVPKLADKRFHLIAPVISIGIAIGVYAVIPFGDSFTVNIGGSATKIWLAVTPHVNVGILFILAMTSLGVYGITLANFCWRFS